MRYALLALVLLALALYALGALLPATRTGRASILIAAPPEAILATIRDYQAQVEWREGIAAVRAQGESWVETTTRGDDITFTPETMTPQSIILHFRGRSGFFGTWQAEMHAQGLQTQIDVTETVTVPSPLGRLAARLFVDPEKFAQTYLTALKARVEAQP